MVTRETALRLYLRAQLPKYEQPSFHTISQTSTFPTFPAHKPALLQSRTHRSAPVRHVEFLCRRHFSISPSHHAARGVSREPRTTKEKPQPSVRLMKKEILGKMKVDERVLEAQPLPPNTFIPLPASRRPPWRTARKDRWLYEKTAWRSWAQTLGQLALLKFWYVRTRDPEDLYDATWSDRLRYRLFEWYDFERFKVAGKARELYERMYSALAKGDLEPVQDEVNAAFLQNLQSRVAARPRGSRWEWKLHDYARPPRLVSYLVVASGLDPPGWQLTFLQQAVVEVESWQSIKKTVVKEDAEGGKSQESGQGQETGQDGKKLVTEYVVLHKAVVEGREQHWKLWGMATPKTLEDIKKELEDGWGLTGE